MSWIAEARGTSFTIVRIPGGEPLIGELERAPPASWKSSQKGVSEHRVGGVSIEPRPRTRRTRAWSRAATCRSGRCSCPRTRRPGQASTHSSPRAAPETPERLRRPLNRIEDVAACLELPLSRDHEAAELDLGFLVVAHRLRMVEPGAQRALVLTREGVDPGCSGPAATGSRASFFLGHLAVHDDVARVGLIAPRIGPGQIPGGLSALEPVRRVLAAQRARSPAGGLTYSSRTECSVALRAVERSPSRSSRAALADLAVEPWRGSGDDRARSRVKRCRRRPSAPYRCPSRP